MFNHLLITTATLERLKLRLVRLAHCSGRRPIQRAVIMTQTRLSMTPTGHSLIAANVLTTTRPHPRNMPPLNNLLGVNASKSHRETLVMPPTQRCTTHTKPLAPTRPKSQPRLRRRMLFHSPCMVLRHLCSKRSITRGEEILRRMFNARSRPRSQWNKALENQRETQRATEGRNGMGERLERCLLENMMVS